MILRSLNGVKRMGVRNSNANRYPKLNSKVVDGDLTCDVDGAVDFLMSNVDDSSEKN